MQRCVATLAACVLGAAVCVTGEGMPADPSKESAAGMDPAAGELSKSLFEVLDATTAPAIQALDPATGSPAAPRAEPQPLDPALDPALAVPALAPPPAPARAPGAAPRPLRRSLPPVPPPAPPGQMVLEIMSKLRRDNDDYLEKGGGDLESNRRMADISSSTTQNNEKMTESSSQVTESSAQVTESNSQVTESSSQVTESSSQVTESSSQVTESSSQVTESSSRGTESTPQSSSNPRTMQSSFQMILSNPHMTNNSRRMDNTSAEPVLYKHHHHNRLLGGGTGGRAADDTEGRAWAGSKGAAGGKRGTGGKGRAKGRARFGGEVKHPALVALLPAVPRPAHRAKRPAHRTPPPAHRGPRPDVTRRHPAQNKQPLNKNELKKLVRLLSDNKQMMATLMAAPPMVKPESQDGPRLRSGGALAGVAGGAGRVAGGAGRVAGGAGRGAGGAGRGRGVPRAESHPHREHHSSGLDFTSSESEERPLNAAQLDLSPARGERIISMRLKGRICQRNVIRVEGPKYNGRGRMYQEEFKPDKMGHPFDQTRLPKFMIPICCNCCTKSVLGCE